MIHVYIYIYNCGVQLAKEWLQLSCHYSCNAPANLDGEFRHDTDSFLGECVKRGELRRL